MQAQLTQMDHLHTLCACTILHEALLAMQAGKQAGRWPDKDNQHGPQLSTMPCWVSTFITGAKILIHINHKHHIANCITDEMEEMEAK